MGYASRRTPERVSPPPPAPTGRGAPSALLTGPIPPILPPAAPPALFDAGAGCLVPGCAAPATERLDITCRAEEHGDEYLSLRVRLHACPAHKAAVTAREPVPLRGYDRPAHHSVREALYRSLRP